MKFKIIIFFLIFIFFGCGKKNEYKKVGGIIHIPANKINQYINNFKIENKYFYPWSSQNFIKFEKLITIPDYNNISLKNIFDNNVNTCWISKGTNLNTYEKIKLFYHTKGENIKKNGAFIFEELIILSSKSKNEKNDFNEYSRIKKLKMIKVIKWMKDDDTHTNYTEITLNDINDFQAFQWEGGDGNAGYPSTKDDEYISTIELQIEDIYKGNKYGNIILSEIIFLGTLLEPHEDGEGY